MMQDDFQAPKMVSFKQAFLDFFKNYFNFTGRSTRAAYWWIVLLGAIIVFVPTFVLTIDVTFRLLQATDITQSFWSALGLLMIPLIIWGLIILATIIPWIALNVRRLRDAGLRGRGYLVIIVFNIIIGGIAIYFDNSHSWVYLVFKSINKLCNLYIFISTIMPTDTMLTSSSNGLMRFFFREKKTSITN